MRLVSPQVLRILFGLSDKALAFGRRFDRGLTEQGAPLLIECCILFFKMSTLLFSLGLFGIGIRELSNGSLLPCLEKHRCPEAQSV
jgi:hypothetical protein